MEPIDSFDLRLFDLNLLIAFDALMQERSVTRAAVRLRVGQPAMSHSLATLRVLLQDDLLVRTGNQMEPTHRALLIHARVAVGLAELQSAVRLSETFSPEREERTFRLGFASDAELAIMPHLVALLRVRAPGLRLVGHLVEARKAESMLDDGRLDLALGCLTPSSNRFRIQPLYDQYLLCVWHPDRLAIDLPLSREAYLGASHVAMTLDDNLRGCLEAALAAGNATLNVIAGSAQFLSVLSIVAAAPVMTTLPSGVALAHASRFGLVVAPPPLPLSLPPISLLWSARLDLDPASAWLRDRIVEHLSAVEQVLEIAT